MMLLRTLVLSVGLAALAGSASGQTLLSWDQLTDVRFKPVFNEELGIDILQADFGPSVQALDGQTVLLKGYIIPLDPLGTQYVLSRVPMASCFFCGGSGPETVAELRLHPKSIRRYATDDVLTFRGTLQLQSSNAGSLHYVLLNAEKI